MQDHNDYLSKKAFGNDENNNGIVNNVEDANDQNEEEDGNKGDKGNVNGNKGNVDEGKEDDDDNDDDGNENNNIDGFGYFIGGEGHHGQNMPLPTCKFVSSCSFSKKVLAASNPCFILVSLPN